MFRSDRQVVQVFLQSPQAFDEEHTPTHARGTFQQIMRRLSARHNGYVHWQIV